MKFIISTQELNYLLNKIQNVVPLKPTMPILANFLIEAYNDELILTATDLTVGIRCFLTDVSIQEEGATTLPARKFAQLIRELTHPSIEISTNSNEVTQILAGTSRFKLNGINKNGFPYLPDLSQAVTFSLSQKELKTLLSNTSFATSKDDTRYVLNGVHMHIENGFAIFIGTDGKRLSKTYLAVNCDPAYVSSSIIPSKAVEEIMKNLLEEGEVKISVMADKIAIEANQTLLITKLLIGDYPDVNRIIPENPSQIITLHREEFISILRQVALFVADTAHSARFTFANGELTLSANTKEIGEGNVAMPIDYQGEVIEIALNPLSIIGILSHCKEEVVSIGLTDPYNPVIIVDGEQTEQLHQASPLFVIMPMRLSTD